MLTYPIGPVYPVEPAPLLAYSKEESLTLLRLVEAPVDAEGAITLVLLKAKQGSVP